MIRVNSKVNLNMAKIRQLDQASVAALEQTADMLHGEIVQARIVPRKDGTLQGESFFVDTSHSANGQVRLVHATPYARRLYFHPEYDFQKGPWEEEWTDKQGKKHHFTHEGNPNAKGLWFEDYEAGGKYESFCKKAFAAIYRRLAGL